MDDTTLRARFAERHDHHVPQFRAMLDAPRSSRRIRPIVPVAVLGIAICVAAVLMTPTQRESPASAADLMAWTAATDVLLPGATVTTTTAPDDGRNAP